MFLNLMSEFPSIEGRHIKDFFIESNFNIFTIQSNKSS